MIRDIAPIANVIFASSTLLLTLLFALTVPINMLILTMFTF